AYAESHLQRGGLASDRDRGPVRVLQYVGRLNDRDEGRRAIDHADVALGELLPQIGAIDGARVGLSVAGSDQTLEESEGLDVSRAVEGVLAVGLVTAAVTEHPQERLGLGLLGAQRKAEADLAHLLDLRGVGLDLGPGLRGGRDASRR